MAGALTRVSNKLPFFCELHCLGSLLSSRSGIQTLGIIRRKILYTETKLTMWWQPGRSGVHCVDCVCCVDSAKKQVKGRIISGCFSRHSAPHLKKLTHLLWQFIWLFVWWNICFPGGTSGKEPYKSTCQCSGFYPWVGKIPWRRAWQPTPLFLPGESPWTEEPGRV